MITVKCEVSNQIRTKMCESSNIMARKEAHFTICEEM